MIELFAEYFLLAPLVPVEVEVEEEEEEEEEEVAAVVEYGGGGGFMVFGIGRLWRYAASSTGSNDGSIGVADDDNDEFVAAAVEEEEGVVGVVEEEEEEELETLCATSDVEIFDAFNASMYFKPCVSKSIDPLCGTRPPTRHRSVVWCNKHTDSKQATTAVVRAPPRMAHLEQHHLFRRRHVGMGQSMGQQWPMVDGQRKTPTQH